jgi:hypothetical protein
LQYWSQASPPLSDELSEDELDDPEPDSSLLESLEDPELSVELSSLDEAPDEPEDSSLDDSPSAELVGSPSLPAVSSAVPLSPEPTVVAVVGPLEKGPEPSLPTAHAAIGHRVDTPRAKRRGIRIAHRVPLRDGA